MEVGRIGWKLLPKVVAKELCCKTFTRKHRHHEESGLDDREQTGMTAWQDQGQQWFMRKH